jgi:hypothetical protein
MRTIDTVYIDGQFVTPHGEELFDLFNPATEEKIVQVRLTAPWPRPMSWSTWRPPAVKAPRTSDDRRAVRA